MPQFQLYLGLLRFLT